MTTTHSGLPDNTCLWQQLTAPPVPPPSLPPSLLRLLSLQRDIQDSAAASAEGTARTEQKTFKFLRMLQSPFPSDLPRQPGLFLFATAQVRIRNRPPTTCASNLPRQPEMQRCNVCACFAGFGTGLRFLLPQPMGNLWYTFASRLA